MTASLQAPQTQLLGATDGCRCSAVSHLPRVGDSHQSWSFELRYSETTIKHLWRLLSKMASAWGINQLALRLNFGSMAKADRFIA